MPFMRRCWRRRAFYPTAMRSTASTAFSISSSVSFPGTSFRTAIRAPEIGHHFQALSLGSPDARCGVGRTRPPRPIGRPRQPREYQGHHDVHSFIPRIFMTSSRGHVPRISLRARVQHALLRVAAALRYGGLGSAQFTSEAVTDRQVRALMNILEIRQADGLLPDNGLFPAEVQVRLKDARTLTVRCDIPPELPRRIRRVGSRRRAQVPRVRRRRAGWTGDRSHARYDPRYRSSRDPGRTLPFCWRACEDTERSRETAMTMGKEEHDPGVRRRKDTRSRRERTACARTR